MDVNKWFDHSYIRHGESVSPLKKKSIRRLELTAAIVMSRLAKFIEDAMEREIDSTHFWVDSQTVLAWVRSASANFKPFVSARIQEIQDTHPRFMEEFRYVLTCLNSADALTKPLSVPGLLTWHKGPQFLRLQKEMWSQDSPEDSPEVDTETLKEGRQEKTPRRRRLHHLHADDSTEQRLATLVSDWDRLTRHVAQGRRFLLPKADRPLATTIGAEEMKNARYALFFLCQSTLREDWEDCRSTFANLAPMIDTAGFIRAEGRLDKLPLPLEVRHPIILPGGSRWLKCTLDASTCATGTRDTV